MQQRRILMKITALLLLAISTLTLNSIEQGYAAVSSDQAMPRDIAIEPIVVAQADTLVTQDYVVTVAQNCPEGDVTCDDVTYSGINANTGDSLDLQGKTVHSTCADNTTPCQFIGYEFFNGPYRYFVNQNGTLQVFQNDQLILEQAGTWDTTSPQ